MKNKRATVMPVDITAIIASVRKLRAHHDPDTIVFVGWPLKGNAKQRKKIKFRNRRMLRAIVNAPNFFCPPVTSFPLGEWGPVIPLPKIN